jgi:hypothetical protein
MVLNINRLLVVEMLKELYAQPWCRLGRRMVTDSRGVKARVAGGDIESIASVIRSHAQYQEPIINGILADQPKESAYSMLYRHLTRHLPCIQSEICCTADTAASLLGLNDLKIETLVQRPLEFLEPGD